MKLVLSTSPARSGVTARFFQPRQFAPVLLAIVLVLGFLGIVLIIWPGMLSGQRYHEPMDVFLKKLERQYDRRMYTAAGYVTVRLSKNTCYRLYNATTYQEVATVDSSLVPLITRELDGQGIEYEVSKNTKAATLIGPGEWVINWGGLLYLPNVVVPF